MTTRVTRRKQNTLNLRFRFEFLERLYDGAPRWYSHEWRKHHNRSKGDYEHTLDREPQVRRAMRLSHQSHLLHRRGDFLLTCVNPYCEVREHVAISYRFNRFLSRKERNRRLDNRDEGLKGLSGAPGAESETCPSCGHTTYVFPLVPIKRKWIYVLKEEGGQLRHYCEVHVIKPWSGHVYLPTPNGKYSDKPHHPFKGYLFLLPHPTRYMWHFFLSPVRLGRESLELLRQSPLYESDIEQARGKANPSQRGVNIHVNLQPWLTTVKRHFDPAVADVRGNEFIPLVDPFTWAAQLTDFDYLPVLSAQQKLVRDSDEQAKMFICSTLQQAVGRKITNENPLEYEDEDEDDDTWNIKDVMIKVPKGTDGSNMAEAWLKRYKAAVTYLTEEVNKSCARIVFHQRFCLAQRIVELACQEGEQKPGYLSIGLMHWHHVLKELQLCEEGMRFIAWLTGSSGEDDDPLRPSERIPVKNVMKGEELSGNTAVASEVGGLPAAILATLSSGIIARSDTPAVDMVNHLGNINVDAASFKPSDIASLRDWVVDIPADAIKKYSRKLPGLANSKRARRVSGWGSWSDRFKLVGNMAEFDKAISLLLAIKDYSNSGAAYESEYSRFERKLVNQVKAPVDVASFLTRNARRVIKANLRGDALKLINLIDSNGTQVVRQKALRRLSTAQYEVWIARRSVRTYRILTTTARIFAGPVALIIGGVELVSHGLKAKDAWEDGDPGMAMAHGIQAAAGLMIIVVAGAECAALFAGAAAAAWAGPVGWIAAGLMLIGTVVITVWSMNDLQKFARHCFLGDRYGEGGWGGTDIAWLSGESWASLRYVSSRRHHKQSPLRWQRQRLALLSLISGFRTWSGPTKPNIDGFGGFIHPSHITDASCFHVKIVITPKGQKTPRETHEARIWPKGEGESFWIGQDPPGSGIKFDGRSNDVAGVFILPRNFPFRPKAYHYEFYVRLDLDGAERNFLPSNGQWIKNGSDLLGFANYFHTSTSDATNEWVTI